MHKRIAALLTAGLCVAAVGMTPGVAAAKHGADDPAGHVRHSQGSDDSTARSSAGATARRGRGADDPAGHQRHGHGTDDGPNHT